MFAFKNHQGWKICAVFFIFSLAGGCGKNPTGTITGKVISKGITLQSYEIAFGINETWFSATVKEDGTYEAANVPWGKLDVKIAVFPSEYQEIKKKKAGVRDQHVEQMKKNSEGPAPPEAESLQLPEPTETFHRTFTLDKKEAVHDINLD